MVEPSVSEITQPFRAWAGGAEQSGEILSLRHCLKNERPERTLQLSDRVHEAYIHLADLSRLAWQHRIHLFAVSATLMRRILVDRARKRLAGKRDERARIVESRFFTVLEVKETAEVVRG